MISRVGEMVVVTEVTFKNMLKQALNHSQIRKFYTQKQKVFVLSN